MRKKKKNAAAVALGSLGGKARLRKMTAEQRSEIARLGGNEKARKAKAKGEQK